MNRAIIYSNPGTIETKVVELAIPEPGPGEVLVRLYFSGVCHTDYGFCTNSFTSLPLPTAEGQVGGHEGIGEVLLLGPGVTGPAVGTRVGIKYAADACLNCENCLIGGETSCPSVRVSGYYTPGTFQQYCVSSAVYVTPIPDGIDSASAAPLMCGGVTVYAALYRAGIRFGDWVVVAGAGGGLGHLAIQYAKALGGRVLAMDAGSKKDFCLRLGADAFVDFMDYATDSDLKEAVDEKTGGRGGAQIVLMCSSNKKAYVQAYQWLGFRGTLVCLGVPEGESPAIGPVEGLIFNELKIMAIKTGNRFEMMKSLEIAAQGKVKTHMRLRRMTSLTKIFKEMEEGSIQGRAVIDLR